MTVQLERPAASTAPAAPATRSPIVVGAIAAAWAGAVGLAAVVLVVLAVWLLAPHADSTPVDAIRAGALVWLGAHHVAIDMQPDGLSVSLVPLGLMAVPVVALYRCGRWAGRMSAEALPAATAATATIALTYGVGAAVLASATRDSGSGVSPLGALAGTLVLAAVAGGAGVLSGSRLWGALADRLPEPAAPVARGALAGLATLVGGGALLLAFALAFHGGEVARLSGSLGGGVAGGVALLLLGVLAVPSAAVWAAAYAVGPGFALGLGTSVSPSGVHLGPVPAFPLLGSLPGTGPAPGISLLALVVPPAAGVVVGLLAARRPARTRGRTAAEALASGLLAGAGLGILAMVSSGSLGAVRLSDLGPDPLAVAGAAALEVGAVAAAVAWEVSRHDALARRTAARLRRTLARLPRVPRPRRSSTPASR